MRFLVTGANGLLGRAMVDYLLERGEVVRSFDLHPYPNPNVENIVGDLRDADAVSRACVGVDAVLHLASVVYVGLGKPQFMADINVMGTQNIINACLHHGVPRLVYTSSIDVVFDGTPIRNGDETLPYPKHHLDYYGETKTLAEKAVLAANGQGNLRTCVLRPSGIYGAGDKHRFPAVIAQYRTGKPFRMGDGHARFNHVYAENVAHAHYLAACALDAGSHVAGQTYFITDHAPKNFFDFTHAFMEGIGFTKTTSRNIPAWAASLLAKTLALRWRIFPTEKHANVLLTRYSVASVCGDFWFNSDKAKRDFGYQPIVDEQTAFNRTLAWLKDEVK